MSDEVKERDLSADEILAVLVSISEGGEIIVPVQAFIDATIYGKQLAIEARDDYTKIAILLVDGEDDE